MDATPISFGSAFPMEDAHAAGDARAPADAFARGWAALHDAARLIASLAGTEEPLAPEVLAFPDALREAPPWRRALAEHGLDDLSAIVAPGLSALIALHAEGRDAAVPAQALWDEFTRSRDALIAMAKLSG
jgi:hypothetical protein